MECQFPHNGHTVWLWDKRGADHTPYPVSAQFDNHEDAMARVEPLIKNPPDWLAWIRVFRFDNESYECLRWTANEATE